MTSCSLTRIEGLLRVQVAGEGNEPFYLTFAISPHISLLSKSIIPNASRRSTIPITPSLPPSIRGLPPCSRMPRDAVQAPDAWRHLKAPYFPALLPPMKCLYSKRTTYVAHTVVQTQHISALKDRVFHGGQQSFCFDFLSQQQQPLDRVRFRNGPTRFLA